MPIAFEIQQGLPCVFTNLPNLFYVAYIFAQFSCYFNAHPSSEIEIARLDRFYVNC